MKTDGEGIETLNWGSHLPALMACVAACDGPVLEIGCGHFSTPCLHALCSALGKELVTLEVHDGWRERFVGYSCGWHRVLKQTDDVVRGFGRESWGVVFIDDDADNRLGWMDVFFGRADYVLFHDCNFPCYDGPLRGWLERNPCEHRIYTMYSPHTLVVSRKRKIPELQP